MGTDKHQTDGDGTCCTCVDHSYSSGSYEPAAADFPVTTARRGGGPSQWHAGRAFTAAAMPLRFIVIMATFRRADAGTRDPISTERTCGTLLPFPKVTAVVPQILHQTSKHCDLLPIQRHMRGSCVAQHSGWDALLWDDNANRRLVAEHYPDHLHMFDRLPYNISRADAARLFYLHRFGGVYLDLDFACLKPLTSLLAASNDTFFVAPQFQCGNHCRNHQKRLMFANAFMAAPPRHAFTSFLVELLKQGPAERVSGTTRYENSVMLAAGPQFLTTALKQWRTKKSSAEISKIRELHFCEIFGTEWNQQHPCSTLFGLGKLPWHNKQLTQCARRFPSLVTTTFWHASWTEGNVSTYEKKKQLPVCKGNAEYAQPNRSSGSGSLSVLSASPEAAAVAKEASLNHHELHDEFTHLFQHGEHPLDKSLTSNLIKSGLKLYIGVMASLDRLHIAQLHHTTWMQSLLVCRSRNFAEDCSVIVVFVVDVPAPRQASSAVVESPELHLLVVVARNITEKWYRYWEAALRDAPDATHLAKMDPDTYCNPGSLFLELVPYLDKAVYYGAMNSGYGYSVHPSTRSFCRNAPNCCPLPNCSRGSGFDNGCWPIAQGGFILLSRVLAQRIARRLAISEECRPHEDVEIARQVKFVLDRGDVRSASFAGLAGSGLPFCKPLGANTGGARTRGWPWCRPNKYGRWLRPWYHIYGSSRKLSHLTSLAMPPERQNSSAHIPFRRNGPVQVDKSRRDDQHLSMQSPGQAMPNEALHEIMLHEKNTCRAFKVTSNHSVVFIRIPKTGSKSLLDGIDLGVHPAKLCDWFSCCCQSYEQDRKDARHLRQGNGWSCGVKRCACQTHVYALPQVWWQNTPHILWVEHELMASQASRKVVWLTWLRHPLARVVSEYLHAQSRPVLWDYTMRANTSFLEFVTSQEYAVGAQNRMVRMLGGHARALADEKEGRAATDLAKERLMMTTFFGLLERPRESLWLLRQIFPYVSPSSSAVRRDASDGSSADLQRMLRLPGVHGDDIAISKALAANSLDEELYEFATHLLKERLLAMRTCDKTHLTDNSPKRRVADDIHTRMRDCPAKKANFG